MTGLNSIGLSRKTLDRYARILFLLSFLTHRFKVVWFKTSRRQNTIGSTVQAPTGCVSSWSNSNASRSRSLSRHQRHIVKQQICGHIHYVRRGPNARRNLRGRWLGIPVHCSSPGAFVGFTLLAVYVLPFYDWDHYTIYTLARSRPFKSHQYRHTLNAPPLHSSWL